MRTIQSLIDARDLSSCNAFEAECEAWADEAGADAEPQLRTFISSGGDLKDVLNVLSAISTACECDLEIAVPAPVQETQPDGSIRCSTPIGAISRFFPDKHANLETIYAELRNA